MISVGNSNGILRFGSRQDKGMEEGEACCNDENTSSTIDPDVALSYIDEKLQDVLGQFYKDFEGGAENLGARFGAYGSFLPAYQHSPSWSHPRTPLEDNHHGSRSPYNGQLQTGQTISLYSSPGIISSNSVNGLRPAFCIDQRNQVVHPLPYHGKELTSKSELPRSTNLFDKKSLKVCIKVDKDDLSSRKDAEIYSGLGLDVPDESLSRIIQIMTSATLFGRLLLTPLPDELIRLTEKESITGEREPNTEDTSNQGSSRILANGSDLKITDRKMFHGNKPKLTEQSLVSVSPVNDSEKYVSHATSVVPKKETDIDSLFCEDNMKRRKGNDALESDVTDPENHTLRSRNLLKGCYETEEKIQKKARVSKSEGKDCKENTHYSESAKKISRGTKDILGHDLVSIASQQSTYAVDPLRRNLGALQPAVVATSSSSKVSSSLRSKASLHEIKGSPIESVSSSPLRASNVLHFNHTRLSSHDEPIFDSQTEKMRSDDNMHLLGSVKNNTKTSRLPANRLTHSNVSSPDQGMHKAWQIETLDQNQNEKNERERIVSRHAGHSKKVTHFDPIDASSHKEKSKAGSNKSQVKFSISCDRTDKSHVSSEDSAGNPDCGNCKDEIPSKVEVHDGTGASRDLIACQDMKQRVQRNSRSLYSDKITEDSERGKSSTKQPSLRGQNDSTTNLKPVVELKTEEGDCTNENDEQSKALKQFERPEKDSSSQAFANVVKEAKDLKHLADRFKNSGSTTDRTGIYFQAALKFLHGASLLESCSSENGKQTKIRSMEMYSSTAKLCEFCAHEYEKSRDMAAAALAYKCVEVAYMRVIYTSHTGVSEVRNEVQTALQLIPTGDSPSSRASDIDNFNNAAIIDKAIASKGVGSPQVLTACTRTSCMHLIQFAQEVNSAMEASRKSRSRLGEVQNKEGISSVKRAIDFNFQDVDGLLHLVRMAIEAINR